MGATVLQRDERSYMVFTTMGSLRSATEDLSQAPFLHACASSLAVTPEVGIGLGRTPAEAEGLAQEAIELATSNGAESAYLVPREDVSIALPAEANGDKPEVVREPDPNHAVLTQIVTTLEKEGETSRVVDAEKVARLQGVTLRTARRTLHSLVDAGLAWPMPPAREQKVGRPRIRFQLLDRQPPH